MSDPLGNKPDPDSDGRSKGTPRMRRALKWAKEKYGEDANIFYNENGQLILRAKFAYALNYSTAPASGNTLAEVVVVSGRQDFVLSEGYLKSNFSTWNKVKNVVSAGLDLFL